jgi:hypothetical protein
VQESEEGRGRGEGSLPSCCCCCCCWRQWWFHLRRTQTGGGWGARVWDTVNVGYTASRAYMLVIILSQYPSPQARSLRCFVICSILQIMHHLYSCGTLMSARTRLMLTLAVSAVARGDEIRDVLLSSLALEHIDIIGELWIARGGWCWRCKTVCPRQQHSLPHALAQADAMATTAMN